MPYVQDDYSVSARGYLNRCRERLSSGTKSGLFYAAFELRCCVEARMAEYLEHYVPYRDKKVQPFKIGENAKLIRRISSGELITKLTFHAPWGYVTEQYHTPVPKSLKDYCERHIDSLRHAQTAYRQHDDVWWENTRASLVQGYRSAWLACQGDMMLPPLWDKDRRHTHPMIFNRTDENKLALGSLVELLGIQMEIEVEYLHDAPSHWVCDL